MRMRATGLHHSSRCKNLETWLKCELPIDKSMRHICSNQLINQSIFEASGAQVAKALALNGATFSLYEKRSGNSSDFDNKGTYPSTLPLQPLPKSHTISTFNSPKSRAKLFSTQPAVFHHHHANPPFVISSIATPHIRQYVSRIRLELAPAKLRQGLSLLVCHDISID